MSSPKFAACLATATALVLGATAAPTTYTAPREGLDAAGMNYQLGIWTAILLIAIGIYGFYSLGSLDYSGDTALFVDPGAETHSAQ
jgi:hypothetical protein